MTRKKRRVRRAQLQSEVQNKAPAPKPRKKRRYVVVRDATDKRPALVEEEETGWVGFLCPQCNNPLNVHRENGDCPDMAVRNSFIVTFPDPDDEDDEELDDDETDSEIAEDDDHTFDDDDDTLSDLITSMPQDRMLVRLSCGDIEPIIEYYSAEESIPNNAEEAAVKFVKELGTFPTERVFAEAWCHFGEATSYFGPFEVQLNIVAVVPSMISRTVTQE